MQTITRHEMSARLAAALVQTQTSSARFVANDMPSADSDYECGYASHEAICNTARRVCVDSGIGILLAGNRAITVDDCPWISVTVVVFHESGEAIPDFELQVPVRDDDLTQAIANAQRMAYSQVLGLQWNSPGVEGFRASVAEYSRSKSITVDVDVVDSGDDVVSPIDDGPEPEPVVPEVIEKSRGALQVLRTQFGFDSVDVIYATATGRAPEWPAKPTMLEYMAIVQLALVCELLADGGDIPRTHSDFLLEAKALELEHLRPIFTYGCPTKDVQD